MITLKRTKEVVNTNEMLLHDLYLKAKDIQDDCHDTIMESFDIARFALSGSYNKPFLSLPLEVTQDTVNYDLTKFALSQLCNKIGVPLRYIQKCIGANMKELVENNINSWIKAYKNPVMLRFYKNSVRGILSSKYSALDAPDILTGIGEVLNTDDFLIKGSYLSPERLHARLVHKEPLNINSEDLFAGIQIDSSDVGRKTLTVTFMIFKQVCTNGLCINKANGLLFQQKHIGVSASDFKDKFNKSIECFPDLVAEYTGVIKNMLKEPDIVGDIDDFIKNTKINLDIGEKEAKKVLDLMQNKYSMNRWGYINSVTELAQEYSLEKRLELENLMGNILVA